jgi:hypothetical protein
MYHSDFRHEQIEYQFRGAERMPVMLDALLVGADGTERTMRLRDVSSLGFMAECPEFVAIGSQFTLHLPGLAPRRAEVRWGLAGWIGCRFEEELNWTGLGDLLGQARQDQMAVAA